MSAKEQRWNLIQLVQYAHQKEEALPGTISQEQYTKHYLSMI